MFKLLISTLLLILSNSIFPESKENTLITNKYLLSIANNPTKLNKFFYEIPKGGDLHYHLGGASSVINLLKYSLHDSICIDKAGIVIPKINNCLFPNDIINNKRKLNELEELWSMKNFNFKHSIGQDHFFSTFDKFSLIIDKHNELILAETIKNAAKQNEGYLEIMITPDHGSISRFGKMMTWNNNFDYLKNELIKLGIRKTIFNNSHVINMEEKQITKILRCKPNFINGTCKTRVGYIYQIFREQQPTEVFAQMLAGFELSSIDARFVGVNLVQREDGPISMRDYNLHMKMLAYFHALYPKVNVTLHAGELSYKTNFNKSNNYHIGQAITIAGAKRIGHGTDIIYEAQQEKTLKKLSQKKIAVEISLTSNAKILGIPIIKNPFSIYQKNKIPIVLSTDDEGILNTNLSNEYFLAFKNYKLSYSDIKNISRNSLTFSFLPGESLWYKPYTIINPACRLDVQTSKKVISKPCKYFLKLNRKAMFQFLLEKKFLAFENTFIS